MAVSISGQTHTGSVDPATNTDLAVKMWILIVFAFLFGVFAPHPGNIPDHHAAVSVAAPLSATG